ncbi:hypothetical protein [Streptomyces sp. CBMA156]|uniref:hypothetical protein n=1 Tax=Streptomyces sp. CBMA156 TaxID=1930280 RepID=UPI0016619279|nr:hypothetical protein [Streptomyces sp. CBMA156]MBD0676785.1 hypothetical protein [Streptomyces sp. CBMA156]
MSHFALVVALPGAAGDDVPGALRAALAPFRSDLETDPYPAYLDGAPAGIGCVAALRAAGLLPGHDHLTWDQVAEAHNRRYGYGPGDDDRLHVDGQGRAYFLSTDNRNGELDYHLIGGLFAGHFLPLPGAGADPRLIHPAGPAGERPRCDGGPRALLDLDGHRDVAVRQAAGRHDRWTALVDGLPPARPWPDFRARHDADPAGYPVERARQDHRAQPRCLAAAGTEEFAHWDGGFAEPRDRYAAAAREAAVPGHALLRLDGTWTDADAAPSRDAYLRAANGYLDDLDGGTILVALDCHC